MKTVLSVGAHPDDIEIGCGGSEILLRQKGYSLVHVVATNGEEGSLTISKEELSAIRQREARESANVIGAEEVVFLGLPDGSSVFTKENKIALIKLIRHFKPEVMFTHATSDHFPDHAMVHLLSLEAIEGAKGPWYSEAGDQPHQVKKVFGFEVWHPINRYQAAINISDVMETKILALSKHHSQTEGVDYMGAIQGLAKYRGAMAMAGSHAEVFEVFRTEIL